ncbi:Uncharacterized protein SCF082_LOCUS32161, partial [Durusdinium trenchii]
DIPPEIPQVPHEYLLVYSRSSIAEMTTPAFVKLEDADGLVSNVTFVDQDLDEGELGGLIQWRVAGDVLEVTRYAVFLAEDVAGSNRSLLGYSTGAMANSFQVPPETPVQSFTHITVFAESSLVLSTTPYAVKFFDNVASVTALFFFDRDADAEEIGGPISWSLPAALDELVGFRAYLAQDAIGTGSLPKLMKASLKWTMVDLPSNTPVEDYTHILVYTVSNLVEQTTPVATNIEDAGLIVSEAGFEDLDLDLMDIGGPVSWNLSGNVSDITAITWRGDYDINGHINIKYAHIDHYFYILYHIQYKARTFFADQSVPAAALIAVHSTAIAADTWIDDFTSSLAEQTTPVTLLFNDTSAPVVELHFPDLDLDLGELGGDLLWQDPVDDSCSFHF